MVETIANFTQKKMEVFSGYSAVRVEPMFCIAPKSLDTVNMISSLGSAQVFSDHDMITPNSQGSICMPVIGIIQTSRPSVLSDKADQLGPRTPLNRKSLDEAIALQNPKYDNLASCTPPAFAFPVAAKGGFVALNGTFKRHTTMLFKSTTSSDQAEKPFDRRCRGNAPKTHPINSNAKGKKLYKFSFCSVGKPTTFPNRFNAKTITTLTAFQPAIRKLPRSRMLTFCTSFHS